MHQECLFRPESYPVFLQAQSHSRRPCVTQLSMKISTKMSPPACRQPALPCQTSVPTDKQRKRGHRVRAHLALVLAGAGHVPVVKVRLAGVLGRVGVRARALRAPRRPPAAALLRACKTLKTYQQMDSS